MNFSTLFKLIGLQKGSLKTDRANEIDPFSNQSY
jgi:hypothetical protein